MKKAMIFSLAMFTALTFVSQALALTTVADEEVEISVGVLEAISLTLDKTTIDFGSHNPGETSWEDEPTPDPWTMPGADATVTAKCIANNGSTWYLYATAPELAVEGNPNRKIDYTVTYNNVEYANYGWAASTETGKGDLNEHKYPSRDDMMPYGIGFVENNRVYTSAENEGGAELYIWTGIQLPFSVVADTYTSTVTYTLAQ